MTAEIGQFALILALVVSLIGAVMPLVGAAKGWSGWMRSSGAATATTAIMSTFALGALTYGFITSDFSILNVARHSNLDLPWVYKVAAVWGSHEGSILFWVTTLAWWSLAVAISARRLPEAVLARLLATLSAIAFGLFAFIVFTSNPFLRLFPPASNGADLNPLLQDPGMIFHPPLLYLGYVGFAVPFAFSIAALLGGRLDVDWARWMRECCDGFTALQNDRNAGGQTAATLRELPSRPCPPLRVSAARQMSPPATGQSPAGPRRRTCCQNP